ncbi:MAG: hypothetical protein Q8Q06_04435 [bacterium]|nr:hypothetical protein [bacterium]
MEQKENLPVSDPRQKKQKRWDEIATQVETIGDKLGKGIDGDIKETVIAFRVLSFETTASCEGHLGWGVASPWVDIEPVPRGQRDELIKRYRVVNEEIEKEEALDMESEKLGDPYGQLHKLDVERDNLVLPEIKRLAGLLEEFYAGRDTNFGARIIMDVRPWAAHLQCQGAEIQRINEPDVKARSLEKYQAEFKALTEFLKKKYFEA